MTNHPITPPPELVEKWWNTMSCRTLTKLATRAAQWGADQELEASLEWLVQEEYVGAPRRLRATRRPNPPSEAEQALSLVPEPGGIPTKRTYSPNEMLIIRRALERLQKLEKQIND